MAMRPYAGGGGYHGGRGGSSGRSTSMGASPTPGGGEMSLFGGRGMGMDMFGGRDPFKDFGGGLMGGDPFGGSMMKRFDDMTKDMMSGFGAMPGGGGGMSRMPGGGNGQYACQTFAMSSHMGPDGKMHTERYVSSDRGNHQQKIRESQQAYSNSTTGMDKMGLERQLGERARKIVKERDRNTMEERSTEMLRGMDEGGRSHFDRDFGANAHHMPPHARVDGRMLRGMEGGGVAAALGSGRHQPALSDRSTRSTYSNRSHSMPNRRR
mmetsp:Transcript_131356/g.232078  ORF Transcript_131356/g.232078 Transcript_131356/m.232078 type:complete len:266 (+) Transcript_131356:166-963(+)